MVRLLILGEAIGHGGEKQDSRDPADGLPNSVPFSGVTAPDVTTEPGAPVRTGVLQRVVLEIACFGCTLLFHASWPNGAIWRSVKCNKDADYLCTNVLSAVLCST